MSRQFKGLPASSGIAIGPVWVYTPQEISVERRESCSPEKEWERIEDAISTAQKQLERLRLKTLEQIGEAEAEIFEAHQMFLADPDFLGTIRNVLSEQKINAEAALDAGVESYAQALLALENEYFKARAQDIRDVGRRLLYCLSGISLEDIDLPAEAVVILAEDLTPSDTVQFDRDKILGLCTVKGGPTSHTAILSRSLGVPAVVSVPFNIHEVQDGAACILDGGKGTLLLEPEQNILQAAKKEQQDQEQEWQIQLSAANQPATTQDGHTVEVVANIGSAEDAQLAVNWGAEGVGLLRTEFLYLDRTDMPSEDEQVTIYHEIFEVMGERPVVVRTLDIGGDKPVQYLDLQEEPNPFLGWRAIRMINERPDILKNQFRALLRAGVKADLRIMVPLVSNLNEVLKAKKILELAQAELKAEGTPFADKLQFGIMVEVPSAALMVEHIAEHVDFFSIGTNDLTQYTLAVDRTNERVAALASPYHPAVLKLIARTIEQAHLKGKWVGLCGEMAGDPAAVKVLLGLGLDEFSMAARSIPEVKQKIRQLNLQECRKLAEQALQMPTTNDVISFLSD